MRRVLGIVMLLLAACTSPSYPGIDRPSTKEDLDNKEIIAYIDKRLEGEYYWLDEVKTKSSSFNRNVEWKNYLSASLSRLTTNEDDGYINKRGQRLFYSYISDITDKTRSTTGFGISLHYTIAIIDSDNGYYGFLVEAVYPDSPAAKQGIMRGDVITMVDGKNIDANNYVTLFTNIENSTTQSLRLQYRRQTDGESFATTLDRGTYAKTTVIHNRIISPEGCDTKIGYIAYIGFESEYDEELLAALTTFAAEGVDEVILDLRCNGGGALSSAVKLASALLPNNYEGSVLCSVKRNPKNSVGKTEDEFLLSNTGSILSLQRLTVICSGYSASASELIVMGLRGLDIPVTLIGSQTEGKNCGMDVSRRMIGDTFVEYAPITFMCFNAKGYGDWGEGITPDIDLTTDNIYGLKDTNYPIPRCDWGDETHDVALATAIAQITGVMPPATRSTYNGVEMQTIGIERQTVGVRLYDNR